MGAVMLAAWSLPLGVPGLILPNSLLDAEHIPGACSAGGSTGCFWVGISESEGQTGKSRLAVSVRGSEEVEPGSRYPQEPQKASGLFRRKQNTWLVKLWLLANRPF